MNILKYKYKVDANVWIKPFNAKGFVLGLRYDGIHNWYMVRAFIEGTLFETEFREPELANIPTKKRTAGLVK